MRIDSFKGIHNRVDRHDIDDDACAEAIDVNFTNSGGIVARKGYAKSLAGKISASYTDSGGVSYIVSDGQLYRVGESLALAPISASTATSFCDSNGVLFTNDGLRVIGDTVVSLAIPFPAYPPRVAITPSQSLYNTFAEGTYAVAYCYISANGLRSAASPIIEISLSSRSEISIVGEDRDGYAIDPIIADGEAFFNQSGLPISAFYIGTQGFPDNVASIEVLDSKLYTLQNLSPGMSVVRFSKPFHHHLFDYDRDYFVINDTCYQIIAAGGTLLVAGANGIVAYEPATGALQELATHGAVSGRPLVKTSDGTVYIHMQRGIWSAMPFTPLTVSHVSMPMGKRCAATIVHYGGMDTYIGLHDGQGIPFSPTFDLPDLVNGNEKQFYLYDSLGDLVYDSLGEQVLVTG